MTEYNSVGSGGVVVGGQVERYRFNEVGVGGVVGGGIAPPIDPEDGYANQYITQQIVLARKQLVVGGTVFVGDQVDVSDSQHATIFVHAAKLNTLGDLSSPIQFRLETSPVSGIWFPIAGYEISVTAPEAAPVTGTNAAGLTTLPISYLPTSFDGRQIVFIWNLDTDSPTSFLTSEWATIEDTDVSSLTFNTVTTYAHTAAGTVTPYVLNGAVSWVICPNLLSVTNLRLVVDAASSDKDIVVEAFMTKD